jgi:hypothetical protein
VRQGAERFIDVLFATVGLQRIPTVPVTPFGGCDTTLELPLNKRQVCFPVRHPADSPLFELADKRTGFAVMVTVRCFFSEIRCFLKLFEIGEPVGCQRVQDVWRFTRCLRVRFEKPGIFP